MISVAELNKMIEIWNNVDQEHFNDYCNPEKSHRIRNDRLRTKSMMVVAALRHYKFELEDV